MTHNEGAHFIKNLWLLLSNQDDSVSHFSGRPLRGRDKETQQPIIAQYLSAVFLCNMHNHWLWHQGSLREDGETRETVTAKRDL